MKTLYISDLDGTLLGADAQLSPYTVSELNKLINTGINFTVATARTNATVVKMLSEVNITIPVILMNGVTIYDVKSSKYISTKNYTSNAKNVLFKVIEKYLQSGFIYTIDDNLLATYYQNTDTPNAKSFIEERERLYGKKFTKVESFRECADKSIVYFSIDDTKEKLEKAYKEICKCPDLHAEFYRDIYNTDHWYLEICSSAASKKNAVIELKEMFGFEKVVSFGDNLNDLPMFEVSDESYAVANAKDEVKQKATAVIESNTDDGVVEYLKTL